MSRERDQCGIVDDDDEWGDLITTPNRLIPNEYFVLKAEEMECGEEDFDNDDNNDEKIRTNARDADCCDSKFRVSSLSSAPAAAIWNQFYVPPSDISIESMFDQLPNSQVNFFFINIYMLLYLWMYNIWCLSCILNRKMVLIWKWISEMF